MKNLILSVAFTLLLTYSVSPQEIDSKSLKAREILTKAGEAVGLKKKSGEIKSLFITDSGFSQEFNNVQNKEFRTESLFKTELSYEFPCNIRSKTDADIKSFFAGKQSENQSVTEDILNGSLFSREMEAF
ncbi:MAG TPA: hypothetical protein VK892_22095, partial [Pyrinomonadaceae bacterium]|nr:hypothetical protein [Pyrinomonadaceae bacterium]